MTDLTHVSDADRRAMARQAASADDLRQILSDDGLEYLVCARVGSARVDVRWPRPTTNDSPSTAPSMAY